MISPTIQDAIDFENDRIAYYETQIEVREASKVSADEQIVQTQNAIAGYNAQKDQADTDIAQFNDFIVIADFIKSLLQAQLDNQN